MPINAFDDMEQVAAVLRSTPELLRAQLLPLDPSVLSWRPAPDEWCANEVIGHLIETDMDAFLGRCKTMIKEDYPTLGGMDIHGLVASRKDSERNVAGLLDVLAEQRIGICQWVAELTPNDLKRSGAYARLGELSVGDLVYEWPYHDANHIKQIQDLIQDQVLPHMGEGMRKAVAGM
jgi:hypothetical protein